MNIKIRRYTPADAVAVDEIYDRCHTGTFSRPNLSHVISSAVIEIDGKIVAYGALEIFLEAIMIVDTDARLTHKVTALKELIELAKFSARDKLFDRFYMFPSSDTYMNSLIKHFGMRKCDPIISFDLEGIEETDGK